MIPPENQKYLIKRLKEGWDLRNACNDAKISRPILYRHFKEFPDFKEQVYKVIETFAQRKKKASVMSERRSAMHLKEKSKNTKTATA